MRINQFFTEILGVKLRNERWSWGAIDHTTNRVFLRVWDDYIESVPDGERILVGHEKEEPRPNRSGYNERLEHLDLIRKGATGFGVVCTPKDPEAESWNIKSFDETTLLKLGSLTKEKGQTYAHIDARVPVKELARPDPMTEDVLTILSKKIENTTKVNLVNARVGQGKFREEVLKHWGNRCSVTRSKTLDAIRASHIKPWRVSEDNERLDAYNGLPLVASLDALFDAGLISFASSGALIVSSQLSESEREIFGVNSSRSLTQTLPPETERYLEYHRDCVFKK